MRFSYMSILIRFHLRLSKEFPDAAIHINVGKMIWFHEVQQLYQVECVQIYILCTKKEERATCSKHCSYACFYRKFTHSSHVNLHVWFFCVPLFNVLLSFSLSLSFSLNIFFLFQHSALPTHVRFDMFRIGLWSIW